MLRVIIAVLIIVPALELWLLITAGKAIGWGWTLLLIIATGVTGAWLARWQGLQVLKAAQFQLEQGKIPGEAILDGVCIFAGGLLLLTPGFFTDSIGFLLLLPYTRRFAKAWMKSWLWKQFENGRFVFYRRW